MLTKEKLKLLKESIKKMEQVTIAFSGGVDSTFLLKVAWDVLGDGVNAVTATSSTYPERELNIAKMFTKELGIKHEIIISEELDIEGFHKNPTDRCYYCKKELYTKITEIAKKNGSMYILDGSNFDDISDYRPGMKALKELKIISPLKEAGLVKDEIRKLSKEMNLETFKKQSFACLASRFPYGNIITKEKLNTIDKAEQYLLDLGFKQVRVRHHEDIARIEVGKDEINKFISENIRNKVYNKLSEVGFKYITLDLKGYRTGSMNEVLNLEEDMDGSS